MTFTCKLFIEKYIDQLNNLDTESCFTIFSELYLLGSETYDEVLEACRAIKAAGIVDYPYATSLNAEEKANALKPKIT